MAEQKLDPGSIKIESGWKTALWDEFSQPYFAQIKQFLTQERAKGKTIYPQGPLIFNAFDQTPFDQVKVVILGQDPYHGPGQAMGLCFSVPRHIALPASLKNIYKELKRDLGIPEARHGDLTAWAKQGVFLLNAILTVEQNKAGSHSQIGWQTFTDAVIKKLSDQHRGIIFLLWGNYARSKKYLIDTNTNTVLEAAHPSPLARDAFSGCAHFSKVNSILNSRGETPVNWSLHE
ncbi:MAG TPA: uracil-DNA glycosylase [Saprospiraceae bacterium]|nr:uracil-DNA glycosylase [Saprospiraceae bacterium]